MSDKPKVYSDEEIARRRAAEKARERQGRGPQKRRF